MSEKHQFKRYLTVYVESCTDLLSMDRNGFSDPFVSVTYNGDKSTRKVSPTKHKTLNPKWTREEAEFTFKVDEPLTDTILFKFWDYDKFAANDFLGQLNIPVALAVNAKNGVYDHKFELKDRKKSKKKREKKRGFAHLIFTYTDVDKKKEPEKEEPKTGFDWEIPYSEIQLGKELGRGAFGVVYKGKWRLQDVAIKVLPPEKVKLMTKKDMEEFKAECNLMMNLRPHRNVLTLLGVSSEPGKPICLVTDFVDGGSLESKLHKPEFPIDWLFIVKTVKGMAAGMHHLHKEGLLHRDLAARNVLLTASYTPLISDFGLSRKVELTTELKQSGKVSVKETKFFRGPFKWMAPESLSKNEFSTKSDIWSFGVTVWEILTRQLPFPNMDIYQARKGIVFHHLRLPIAPHWPQKWKDLLTACWHTNPDDRPDFVQIDKMLTEIEEETIKFTQNNPNQQAQWQPKWSQLQQISSYPPQQQVGYPQQQPYNQQQFVPLSSSQPSTLQTMFINQNQQPQSNTAPTQQSQNQPASLPTQPVANNDNSNNSNDEKKSDDNQQN